MEYKKENESEYTLEDYEIFRSQSKIKQKSGEALLGALMKVPFKDDEKVQLLVNMISENKKMVGYFENKIFGLDDSDSVDSNTFHYDRMSETIEVTFVDEKNDLNSVVVVDDVFESVLGNYYLIYVNGVHLPLNRVITIEEDSKVGRWYKSMCKNFEREVKLKRVLGKDGNN